MTLLEKHYGFGIGSYYLQGSSCSAYLTFKEETVELVEKYFGNSSSCDASKNSQEKFCEGQFSFYRQFIKGLDLLDAVHAAWLVIDDFNKVSN